MNKHFAKNIPRWLPPIGAALSFFMFLYFGPYAVIRNTTGGVEIDSAMGIAGISLHTECSLYAPFGHLSDPFGHGIERGGVVTYSVNQRELYGVSVESQINCWNGVVHGAILTTSISSAPQIESGLIKEFGRGSLLFVFGPPQWIGDKAILSFRETGAEQTYVFLYSAEYFDHLNSQ